MLVLTGSPVVPRHVSADVLRWSLNSNVLLSALGPGGCGGPGGVSSSRKCDGDGDGDTHTKRQIAVSHFIAF